MTSSDWGTWLLDDIEDADPDTVAVWYLGCNGFVLKADDGTTVFVDPYLGTGEPPHTVRMIPVPFDAEDVATADAVFARMGAWLGPWTWSRCSWLPNTASAAATSSASNGTGIMRTVRGGSPVPR